MQPIVYVLLEHNTKNKRESFIAVFENEVDAWKESQKCEQNQLNAFIEYRVEDAVLQ